jgi:hypothetical protein
MAVIVKRVQYDHIAYYRPESKLLRVIQQMKQQAEKSVRSA